MQNEDKPLIFNTQNMDPSECLIIVTGPLGGKFKKFTQLLYNDFNEYRKVVLYKTKPKEKFESAGVDGYFIDKQRFSEMVGDGKFLFYCNLPDGNFEGFSHWHASNNKDRGRPLIHTCDYDDAVVFKQKLRDNCNIVYMDELNNVKNSLEDNPEVSYVVEVTENHDSTLRELKNIINNVFKNV